MLVVVNRCPRAGPGGTGRFYRIFANNRDGAGTRVVPHVYYIRRRRATLRSRCTDGGDVSYLGTRRVLTITFLSPETVSVSIRSSVDHGAGNKNKNKSCTYRPRPDRQREKRRRARRVHLQSKKSIVS